VSLAEDALRDAILKTLADDVEAALVKGRASLKAAMAAGKIKSLSAELPDGTPVATLTLAGGRKAPRVVSEARFLAWVQAEHPTEVETVVRPDYQKTLLEGIAQAGRVVDPKTGNAVDGVEFCDTTPYVTPSFAKGDIPGREHIRRAWRDGAISLPSLLGLPGGNGEAPGHD
jgi:hypothetical protein